MGASPIPTFQCRGKAMQYLLSLEPLLSVLTVSVLMLMPMGQGQSLKSGNWGIIID